MSYLPSLVALPRRIFNHRDLIARSRKIHNTRVLVVSPASSHIKAGTHKWSHYYLAVEICTAGVPGTWSNSSARSALETTPKGVYPLGSGINCDQGICNCSISRYVRMQRCRQPSATLHAKLIAECTHSAMSVLARTQSGSQCCHGRVQSETFSLRFFKLSRLHRYKVVQSNCTNIKNLMKTFTGNFYNVHL